MTCRERSIRFASSFVFGLLASGLAVLPLARAQDVTPAAGYPPPPQGADPNAPPPGASPPPAPAGAPPQYGAGIQEPALPPYKPYVLMPFIGFHSFQNDNTQTGPGLRVGAIGGVRANELVSINGELLYDVVNLDNVPSGDDVSVYNFQFALAPLFHLQAAPTFDFLIGPKVGGFHFSETASVYGYSASAAVTGLLVGANVGGFFRLSDMLSLGALASFDWEKAYSCSVTGGTCSTDNTNSLKIISGSVAAMF